MSEATTRTIDLLPGYKAHIDEVCKMACAMPPEMAQAVVSELERMESLMPIVDPTGYRDIQATLPGHLLAARAFLAFRTELEKLRP